ncbi:MAG: hypothetical protein V4616_06895 [Bacteroidota bacterium]
MRALPLLILAVSFSNLHAQQRPEVKNELSFAAYDGAVVAGYVDRGAFMNFTGPNISYLTSDFKLLMGMLPSLRFKEDHSAVKNAFITPNLGVGITLFYRRIGIQLPMYYNAKTAVKNGRWLPGIGIGIRLK